MALAPAFPDSPTTLSSTPAPEAEYADSYDGPAETPEVDEQDPGTPVDGIEPESPVEEIPDVGEPSETVEEPTETDAAATAEEEGEFPADLIESAVLAGFSKDEARAFGSPELLTRALTAYDRQLSALGRQILESQKAPAEEVAPAAPAKPEAPKPAEQTAVEAAVAEFEKLKLELSPDEYDAGTINTLNGINDHYDKLVRQIASDHQQKFTKLQETTDALREVLLEQREQFQQITGRTQAEDSARFEQEMDSFFAGLGDEFKATFGKGAMRSIKADSPERAARLKLVEEMSALQLADAQLNRPRSTPQQLRERALRSLHGDTLKTSARQEILKKADERKTQSLARPAGRQMKARTGKASATRYVEEVLRKRGADYDDGDTEL